MNVSVKHAPFAAATEHDPRWASVVGRDRKADGTFYYSVNTTGVYCRPSRAARLAQLVAIPCHRVVRHDVRCRGYRCGVERKRALLEREGGT